MGIMADQKELKFHCCGLNYICCTYLVTYVLLTVLATIAVLFIPLWAELYMLYLLTYLWGSAMADQKELKSHCCGLNYICYTHLLTYALLSVLYENI